MRAQPIHIFVFIVLGYWLPGSLRAQTPEYRALWVDAWGPGFLTAYQTTQLIADARRYNFNAIMVQMRRRGDAFYMPQSPNLEPRTSALDPNYDALRDLVTKAHSGSPRIEVHCWVPANLIWSGTGGPSDARHVINRHPEYLMKNFAGERYLGEGMYLDPGHPEAMRWNYNLALDIVSRYEIDGFHWDYIRYPQQDAGYNDTALARYAAETGITVKPNPASSSFSDWRRKQVTDFLRWANSEMLARKPQLKISAAVFASRSDAFTHRLQDWAAWNREGLIDLCMPMNYTADNAGVFTPRLNDAAVMQGIRWVIMGQGAYLNTKENTLAQLSSIRSKGLRGSVFYSYRTTDSGTVEQAATLEYIRSNFQPAWASPPALPWKANQGSVKGYVRRADTGALVTNAVVTLHAASLRNVRTSAYGHYAFFDLAPGSATVSVSLAGFGSARTTRPVTAGIVSAVDLVITNSMTLPVRITSVSRAGANLWLEGTAPENIECALEVSEEMESWRSVKNFIVNTSPFQVQDTPTGAHRFYRIRKVRSL